MGLKGNNRSEDPPALVVLGGGVKAPYSWDTQPGGGFKEKMGGVLVDGPRARWQSEGSRASVVGVCCPGACPLGK